MPLDSTNYLAPETKPDVFSLEGLIAWLEAQPPETSYDWEDCSGGCLIGVYYMHHGLPQHGYDRVFGRNLMEYSRVCSSVSGPTTYGAALSRARALLASRNR